MRVLRFDPAVVSKMTQRIYVIECAATDSFSTLTLIVLSFCNERRRFCVALPSNSKVATFFVCSMVKGGSQTR